MPPADKPRAPYEPPVLRPLKLFVEAAVPGCCKVSLVTCSVVMKASTRGGLGDKLNRTSTAS